MIPAHAAVTDPTLLGAHFEGPTWARWRAFLQALDALPMDGDALQAYRHHTGREAAPKVPATEVLALCGRRSGKTQAASALAVVAAMNDWRPFLSAGEWATVGVFASDRAQARHVFERVAGMLEAAPVLRRLVTAKTTSSIDLGGRRVRIEIRTADSATARGYTYCACILDELAHWETSDTSADPDAAIVEAVRPGLLSLPGARLVCITTPWARRGVAFRMWERAQDGTDPALLVWSGTSREMHPGLDAAAIDRAYRVDPVAARTEYEAAFRDDVGTYLDAESLAAVVDAGVTRREPADGVSYVGFIDVSAGKRDSFSIAIAHYERGVTVLDRIAEWKAPFDPMQVTQEAAALLTRYRITSAQSDKFAGEWAVRAFADHGVHLAQDAEPKAKLYLQFLPLVLGQQVKLLEQPVLERQLLALERRARSGGVDLVDHRPGGRDDVANAVAGVSVLVADLGAYPHGGITVTPMAPRRTLDGLGFDRPLDRLRMPQ